MPWERMSSLAHSRGLQQRLSRSCGERLPHARNNFTSVKLDCRHPLFVGHAADGVGQVESTQPEQSNIRRNFGCDGFRGSHV